MVTLTFQVPLSEDGLNSMAVKAKQTRDTYDAKRAPDLYASWHMLYTACMDARTKLHKRKS